MGSNGGLEAYLIALVVVLLGMRRKRTLGRYFDWASDRLYGE
jgi:hypothetical protein